MRAIRSPRRRVRVETKGQRFVRRRHDVLVSCVLASAYGFLQGAWPFGIIEAIWAGVAVRRWRTRTLTVTAV